MLVRCSSYNQHSKFETFSIVIWESKDSNVFSIEMCCFYLSEWNVYVAKVFQYLSWTSPLVLYLLWKIEHAHFSFFNIKVYFHQLSEWDLLSANFLRENLLFWRKVVRAKNVFAVNSAGTCLSFQMKTYLRTTRLFWSVQDQQLSTGLPVR